uniref:Uncharacterized protein n=1 Tax=Nelumbo nucifera TaxID=4432 RepID=A0A822ZIQ1_NELNU|nr:TPA_asm: hypothetical protein HUJ06_002743 [Nelumbo nucifera]
MKLHITFYQMRVCSIRVESYLSLFEKSQGMLNPEMKVKKPCLDSSGTV